MSVQIKDFTLTTSEQMFDVPEVELKAKFIITSAPGEHITVINSGAVKDILTQLLKQAIVLDSAQKRPEAIQKPQEMKKEDR